VTDALEQAGGLGPGSDGAPTTGVGRWATAAQVLAVVVLAVVLQWPRARERDFWFSDASRHALDGVFVVDLVREGGWRTLRSGWCTTRRSSRWWRRQCTRWSGRAWVRRVPR